MTFHRKEAVPFPKMLTLSATDGNDSTVFKREYIGSLNNREIYTNKIYSDVPFYKGTQKCKGTLTIYSYESYQEKIPEVTKREKAARNLFSTTVSKAKQPIEALFSWLNEKTDTQRTAKVRFTSGLLVYTMERVATALIILIFN